MRMATPKSPISIVIMGYTSFEDVEVYAYQKVGQTMRNILPLYDGSRESAVTEKGTSLLQIN